MFGRRRAGSGKTPNGPGAPTAKIGQLGGIGERRKSAPAVVAGPVAVAPEPPRRPTDAIAPATRRVDARPALGELRRLIVGRDISLAGEIRSAERLVVEGRVAANLIDCSALEIAAGGHFHGSATVKSCEVAGSFEGELTVSERLIVRNGGRVNGRINYGEIEIERGGRIGGAIELRDVAPRSLAFRSPTADTLARDLGTRSKPGPANSENSEAHGVGEAESAHQESAVS